MGTGEILAPWQATRSASSTSSPNTANFGAWWLRMQRSLPLRLQISQGERTGRPSILLLEVTAGGEVFVGGDVLEIGRGTITL
jgi:predicted PhzF superfamily epimerase YddE/YHI9